MKSIVCITGTRPQLIKHSILLKALRKYFKVTSINTTQHYQYELNGVFQDSLFEEEDFRVLKLEPEIPPAKRLASMLSSISDCLEAEQPQAVLVYGDTDSTLAGALASNKMKIPLIHVEAGERSFNMQMPEEVNRAITDALSSILFCSSEIGFRNLQNKKIKGQVIFSGDIMKDLLFRTADNFNKSFIEHEYVFCTIHRDYNKNNIEKLKQLIFVLRSLDVEVIFPVHPATFRTIQSLGIEILENQYGNIQFLLPVSYIDCIHYQKFAKAIITDSGGIQKEAYWLGVPCFTFRKETEWVETLVGNWNILIYDEIDNLKQILQHPVGEYNTNLYGDGQAAEIIASKLQRLI